MPQDDNILGKEFSDGKTIVYVQDLITLKKEILIQEKPTKKAPTVQPVKKTFILDSKIPTYVTLLLKDAITQHASEIDIGADENGYKIVFTVDGFPRPYNDLEIPAHETQETLIQMMSFLMIKCQLDITKKSEHQDGALSFSVIDEQSGEKKLFRFRVSASESSFGQTMVIRVLHQQYTRKTFPQLGHRRALANHFQSLVESKPERLLALAVGPTGTGKSTSLHIIISQWAMTKKCITIEDPVEYHVPGAIHQYSVNRETGKDFAYHFKASLRKNPDLMLIGELRDQETAREALDAALAGIRIFSTLHANNACGAPSRLIGLLTKEGGNQDYYASLVAETLNCVLAQYLVHVNCRNCMEPYVPEMSEFRGFFTKIPDHTFYRGRGCKACGGTGFSGRIAVSELLVVDADIAALITKRAPSEAIARCAKEKGMITLREDGVLKVLKGWTTLDEIRRVVPGI